MFNREMNIFVNVPADQVYELVSDIRRHPEWAFNPLEIRHIAGPEQGLGATFSSVAHRVAGIVETFQGQICVVIDEPPNQFAFETHDTSGRYRWTFIVTPEGNGSRLTQRMEKLSGPWILRYVQPAILWPLFGRSQVRGGLENIKTLLEKQNNNELNDTA
jgi:hypothetical protein